MPIKLVISDRLPQPIDPEVLRRVTELTGTAAKIDHGIINLKLVDDAEIQALNKKYADNDYATDVLSFSYGEDGAVLGDEWGDVAISLETAARQAHEAGTPLETEVALLLAHGILHVLGWDHQTAKQIQAMDELQAQIMAQAGLIYRNFEWTTSKNS